MIKLKILRLGDFPGLSSWVQCNQKSSYKRQKGWNQKRQCDDESRKRRPMITEADEAL